MVQVDAYGVSTHQISCCKSAPLAAQGAKAQHALQKSHLQMTDWTGTEIRGYITLQFSNFVRLSAFLDHEERETQEENGAADACNKRSSGRLIQLSAQPEPNLHPALTI